MLILAVHLLVRITYVVMTQPNIFANDSAETPQENCGWGEYS